MFMDKAKDKNKPIDTGIIIIILTASSYALAYAFQVTYMGFYHLPHTFVEMNLTNMMIPLSVTFCLLFLFCSIIYILFYIILRLSSVKFSDLRISVYFILAGILGAAFTIGILYAKVAGNAKDEYMVIKEKEHLFVVITSYKDSLIIAPLDLEKESITPTFKAIEMKELKDAETIHFENGLKVEDVRNSKDLID